MSARYIPFDHEWSPKTLREKLCVQERHAPDALTRDAIGSLIAVLDLHRPLTADGKLPHYGVIQQLVAEASDWFLPNGSRYVDLGASTGTTAEVIAARHPDRLIRVDLYDEQEAMLDEAVHKLSMHENVRLQRHVQRLEGTFTHNPADLTTALFTLQFLRPAERIGVLRKARERSNATGALIIAEKVRPADPIWHELGIDLSHDYKEHAGLSDTAIRQKSRALRGVLMPQPVERVMSEITAGGWTAPETLFRWHQWVVIGALAS